MHYLIDGHNLIGQMPDIDLTDPNDEVKLILRLRSWAAASRKRHVTVIFDGGLPGGKARSLSSSTIQVIFATSGRTADALLISRLKRIKNPSEFRLITGDRQIIKAAQRYKVPFLTAAEFVKRMLTEKTAQTTPTSDNSPATADNPEISQEEVAELLDLFGPVPKLPKKPQQKRPAIAPKPPPRPQKPKTAAQMKSEGVELSQNEIEEWLQLFNNE